MIPRLSPGAIIILLIVGVLGLWLLNRSKPPAFLVGSRVALQIDPVTQGTVLQVLPQSNGDIWYLVEWDTLVPSPSVVDGRQLIRA